MHEDLHLRSISLARSGLHLVWFLGSKSRNIEGAKSKESFYGQHSFQSPKQKWKGSFYGIPKLKEKQSKGLFGLNTHSKGERSEIEGGLSRSARKKKSTSSHHHLIKSFTSAHYIIKMTCHHHDHKRQRTKSTGLFMVKINSKAKERKNGGPFY
jgi:hypothetical protein